ncbi:hypothetical protein SAMN05421663_105288 [Terribacillus halophilus]|uniref:Uncharacterized protein n=1 Tax=Terribacillus halophilus TaxID=361279 RepID=A0A1G6R0G8_9BACI|nr:hypothetical protein SAMN05421663_105288 [Terribacillus halophilus]
MHTIKRRAKTKNNRNAEINSVNVILLDKSGVAEKKYVGGRFV